MPLAGEEQVPAHGVEKPSELGSAPDGRLASFLGSGHLRPGGTSAAQRHMAQLLRRHSD